MADLRFQATAELGLLQSYATVVHLLGTCGHQDRHTFHVLSITNRPDYKARRQVEIMGLNIKL